MILTFSIYSFIEPFCCRTSFPNRQRKGSSFAPGVAAPFQPLQTITQNRLRAGNVHPKKIAAVSAEFIPGGQIESCLMPDKSCQFLGGWLCRRTGRGTIRSSSGCSSAPGAAPDSGTSSSGGNGPSAVNVPQTGDYAPLFLLSLAAILCAGMLILLLHLKRRAPNEKK